MSNQVFHTYYIHGVCERLRRFNSRRFAVKAKSGLILSPLYHLASGRTCSKTMAATGASNSNAMFSPNMGDGIRTQAV